MHLAPCCVAGFAALFALGTACAQNASAPASAPLPEPQAATALPPLPAASAPAKPRLAPQKVVVEDEGARIEETRGRGQTQRITVQSKVPGAKPYEIIVAPGGKDASQNRGAAGQRAWSLFDF